MKNIFKKNQIIITALAIMIAVAGYLNYSGSKLGDDDTTKQAVTTTADQDGSEEGAVTVEDILKENTSTAETGTDNTDDAAAGETNGETQDSAEDALSDIESLDTEDLDLTDEDTTAGEAVLANSSASASFVAEAKVSREQVRAQNKETLLEVINNTNISDEAKQEAITSMVSLTDIAEKESAAETLLEAKGFTDVVVSISEGSVDVIVNMSEVTDAGRAQIEDIVKRKTGVAAENIIITPISVED